VTQFARGIAVSQVSGPGVLHNEGFARQFIAEGFQLIHFHGAPVCKSQANRAMRRYFSLQKFWRRDAQPEEKAARKKG